jgi:hypothetical protein
MLINTKHKYLLGVEIIIITKIKPTLLLTTAGNGPSNCPSQSRNNNSEEQPRPNFKNLPAWVQKVM